MLKKLYRILLTINSLAVFVIIYIIKEKKGVSQSLCKPSN